MQSAPKPRAGAQPAARLESLFVAYQRVRAQTLGLAAPLSAEDCNLQSMLEASPVKWHLAHTSWFFETFVLEPGLPRFAPYREAFRVLFNSYYVAVGPRHPRPERSILSRPSLDEVLAYRASVDERMHALFARYPEQIARALRIPVNAVDVHYDVDVGGSYGMKRGIRQTIVVGYLSRKLRAPVRFIEDRLENMSGGDAHGPDPARCDRLVSHDVV